MYTSGRKQQLGQKKINKCAAIIGKPVISACVNGGDLPHHTAIAWTGARAAYIVNLKKKTALEYVRDGKFILKRIMLPYRVLLIPLTEEQKLEKQKLNDFKEEEKEGNIWNRFDKESEYERIKRETYEAIDRMKERFQPKTMPTAGKETLYQKYIREAKSLQQEVRDAMQNSYGDMT